MKIRFLGAARQVTGSRYLLEAGGLKLMIDCGLFQERPYLARNWAPPPAGSDRVDALLLTHAHLDHCGLIPRMVREGFDRPILTTAPSIELAGIIMEDAARIQEEDAHLKRKRHERQKRSGAYPVTPLYAVEDARRAMGLFRPAMLNQPVALSDRVSVTYHDAGHILGSAMLELTVREGGAPRTVVFSGDVGQWNKPIIRDPSLFERADYVIMESTYGDRRHPQVGDVEAQLCAVINETVRAGGNVLIPTFAVERAQELMYHIGRLIHQDRIPNLLTFLDSPMAVDVTEVFRRHRDYMDADAQRLINGESVLKFPGLRLVSKTVESKAINRIRGSCIIMAGSGMCTAGRIKHHLLRNIGRPECAVVFVGFQARDTLGREILEGRPEVRILGQMVKVKARIAEVYGMSAHADQPALMRWLGSLKAPPQRVFLTHGEPDAAEALAGEIRRNLGFDVEVPEYLSEHVAE